MSNRTFQIHLTRESGQPVFHVSGVLDENADLSPIRQSEQKELHIDLSQVRRINSFGVRTWMEAMRTIPDGVKVYFYRCAPPVIDQCNMVLGFRGHADIVSFHVPLICEECDEQRTALFETEQCLRLGGKLPEVACPNCDNPLELDDLEEHYLLFLHKKLEQPPG